MWVFCFWDSVHIGRGAFASWGGRPKGELAKVWRFQRIANLLIKKPRPKAERGSLFAEILQSECYSAGFFTYLSSHKKNSRFQVSEFCGWNT